MSTDGGTGGEPGAADRKTETGWRGIDVDVRLSVGSLDFRARLSTTSDSVAVVGPSGAGKSTFLRVLAGLERRAEGRVEVGGRVWMDTERGVFVAPWERRVGWVPQDALLFPHLDVERNLAYGMAGRNPEPAAVREVARLLEVEHLLGRRPRNLSGGERQRVAVGRALLARPALLLLDEPLSALDRPLRSDLARRLRERTRREGLPLFLVSHDEEDARVLAGERWHLAEGRLRAED